MIFDDLIADIDLWAAPGRLQNVRDALRGHLIFRIEENIADFSGIKEPNFSARKSALLPLPSPLPYSNVALCFTNAVVLLTQHTFDNNWPALISFYKFHVAPRHGLRMPIQPGAIQPIHVTGVTGTTWWPNLMMDVPLRYDQNGNFLGIVDISKSTYDQEIDQNIDEQNFDEVAPVEPGTKNRTRNAHEVIYRFVSFLSCKNIRVVDFLPDPALQRARVKRGKYPLVAFKVLELTTRSGGGAGAAKKLWTNRVHLCRGHFATYTDDRPLFGKYVGKFWIPPHVKGDKKNGILNKDYSIPRGTK